MKNFKGMKNQQSGFTLVEIAIVLVIIGLLLGGILKGQELINSAKVKALITDMRNIQTQIYGYQDKFRQLPGDDSRTAANFPATSNPIAGSGGTLGNGQIEGPLFPVDTGTGGTASTAETAVFWQHLRLANLAAGPTDPTQSGYLPLNANNGRIGVSTATPAQLQIATMPTGGTQICMTQIPGKFAKQLDLTLDDGVSDSGSVRFTTDAAAAAGPGATATPMAGVNDGNLYTVCMVF